MRRFGNISSTFAVRNLSDSTSATVVKDVIPEKVIAEGEPDKLYSRLEIEVKGADPAVLKSYSWFATTAASHLGIEVGRK